MPRINLDADYESLDFDNDGKSICFGEILLELIERNIEWRLLFI